LVLVVIPVTPVAFVVLLFSLLTGGFYTDSCKLTTKLLLMTYLSGDLDSPTV